MQLAAGDLTRPLIEAARVSAQTLMKWPVVQRSPRAGLPRIVPQLARWRMR